MMDERDIAKLECYENEYFPELSATWPMNEFDTRAYYNRAYSRWAIEEMLERMIYEAMKPPEYVTGVEREPATQIIKDFKDEMEDAYFKSRNIGRRTIFFIAMDTARNVLTLFQEGN